MLRDFYVKFKRWVLGLMEPLIVRLFHNVYYHDVNTHQKNTFLGYRVLQCPFDLHLYQELIYREKPAFVLQTGVFGGGSLFYFASLLDLMGAPASAIVVGVDIVLREEAKKISHPRIHLIEGSSTASETVDKIRNLLPSGNGLVILDSDHSKKHVAAELEIYPDFVAVGSYLVVEDTNINGNPVYPGFGPGPLEAVQDFLPKHPEFIADDALWKRNKFSFHQRGWLRRVRA